MTLFRVLWSSALTSLADGCGVPMLDVEPGRILRVTEAVAAQPSGQPEARVCAATAHLLDAAGVGIALGATDGLLGSCLHTVCATGFGQDSETLQFDLGEGPSYTAYRTGWPVEVPDLEHDDTWPAFATAAAGGGCVRCSPSHCRAFRVGSGRSRCIGRWPVS